jgi:NTE family protein
LSIRKKQIALVLGSGGARGLAHVGVIKAIEENHIPVGIITGTSIGALVGGFYAAGVDVKSMEKIVSDVDKMMVAKILMPKFFGPGFIDNKKVKEFIKSFVGDVKIEDLKISFAAVATDFITGEEVVFRKGLLVDAIMASVAIPAVFQPVFLNNRYLLDGGLSNPLPVSVVLDMKANAIIAVNVSPNPRRVTKKIKTKKTEEAKLLIKKLPTIFSNFLFENKESSSKDKFANKTTEAVKVQSFSPTLMTVFLQSISISTNNLITQQLRNAKPDVLISPKVENFDMLEFYKGHEIIKCGYDAAHKAMLEIKSGLSKK